MQLIGPETVEDRVRRDSVQLPDSELAFELRKLPSVQIVVHIGQVPGARVVRQRAGEVCKPSTAVMRRLRSAYFVAGVLHEHVQSWFSEANPQLGNSTPVARVRDDPLQESGPAVLAAARAFIAPDESERHRL